MDISLHSEVISKFRQWYDADPEEIGCELVILNQHYLPVLRCRLGGGYVDSTTWFYAKRRAANCWDNK